MTENKVEKPHYSISHIHAYIRCPMIEWWRYQKNKVVPPTTSLSFGVSTHAALELNYSQKINSKKDMDKSKMRAYFASKWDEEAAKTEFDPGEKKGEIKDIGIEAIDQYHDGVCKLHQPIEDGVERYIKLKMPEYDFSMKIDLMDEAGVVTDFKTTGKSYAKIDKNNEDLGYKVPFEARNQLSAYRIGYRALFGKNPTKELVEVVVRKKNPDIIVQKVETDEESFLRVFAKVVQMIEAKAYYPNMLTNICPMGKSGLKDEKGCGFYKLCKAAEVF